MNIQTLLSEHGGKVVFKPGTECRTLEIDIHGWYTVKTVPPGGRGRPGVLYNGTDEHEAVSHLRADRPEAQRRREASCPHLRGYWIRRGESFRCFHCGFQFHVDDVPENRQRVIRNPW